MNKPTIFLETTIQIERTVGLLQRQVELHTELANYRLITSTYVLGEYLRTIGKDAIQLHRLLTRHLYLDEVITRLGQHPNKRESSRMLLILGFLLRGRRTIGTKFEGMIEQNNTIATHFDLFDRLSLYIEFLQHNYFMEGIDEILDGTECGLAKERAIVDLLPPDNTVSYRLRCQCVRHVRECDLAERMEAWKPELKALLAGLAAETEPSLVRIRQLSQQIIENPTYARGRNCTWYLGDLIIALELPANVPLYTTNLRHYAPLLAILGKTLHAQ